MTKKTQVNLRLSDDVIKQLKEEASRQKRSLNNLLEVIIDQYLENPKKD